jgi:hypothetical protein
MSRGDGTADNIIWKPLIDEFITFVKETYEFDYNDITDVVRTIENLAATPKDGLKYYVKCDDDNKPLETIYQFDTEGIELFSYKPVYQDRIIFTDTDREIPNYVFLYRMICDKDLKSLTEEEKALLVRQYEEGRKYNNSFIGSKGITTFVGHNTKNLEQCPAVNFLYEKESSVSLYNRRNQANNLKRFNLAMLLTTSNETLYDNEDTYDRLATMQKVVSDLWGKYLLLCNNGIYKSRITGTMPYEGEMINEVTYQPSIIQKMLINIEYL